MPTSLPCSSSSTRCATCPRAGCRSASVGAGAGGSGHRPCRDAAQSGGRHVRQPAAGRAGRRVLRHRARLHVRGSGQGGDDRQCDGRRVSGVPGRGEVPGRGAGDRLARQAHPGAARRGSRSRGQDRRVPQPQQPGQYRQQQSGHAAVLPAELAAGARPGRAGRGGGASRPGAQPCSTPRTGLRLPRWC